MEQKTTTKRLNFTLPTSLYEKVRKEAYMQQVVMGKVVRVALEKHLNRKNNAK